MIKENGKVGIGTVNSSKLLDINGSTKMGNLTNRHFFKVSSSQCPEIWFQTPTSNEKIRIGVAHASDSGYGVGEGDLYIYTCTTNPMPLVVNKNVFLVSKSGNLGIGIEDTKSYR